MRVLSKLVVAAIALGTFSTSASAAVLLASEAGLSTLPGVGAGETMVGDFDGIANSHFGFTGNVFTHSITNLAAEPAGDTTNFGAAEPASASQPFTDATFTANAGVTLSSLSIDIGSLDTYNTLEFFSGGTLKGTFSGSTLAAALLGVANGNQVSDLTNGRFYFTFGASDDINKLVFLSTTPAFEFDNIAAKFSAVPEPATWTMMILGFGFVGFMLRSSRQKTVAVIA